MKPGRKSPADLRVLPGIQPVPSVPAPRDLGPEGRSLWNAIVASRPPGFFSPADLPLLAEYCRVVAVFLPRLNEALTEDYSPALLSDRDSLIRQSLALARALRLCVSSRTRPDVASMRDSQQQQPAIVNSWSSVLNEEEPHESG